MLVFFFSHGLQMGKGPLLSWKALQQDLGLGEIEAAREGGTNIVGLVTRYKIRGH